MSGQAVFLMRCFVLIIVSLDVVNLQNNKNYSNWLPNYIRFFLRRHGLYEALTNGYSKDLQFLEVSYGLNKVEPACRLSDRVVASKPDSFEWRAEDDAYYALMLLGLDCPTTENFNFRSWLHWAVVNIRGNDIKTGEEVTPYIGVETDYEPGMHRLVFLIFRQPDKINFSKSWIARGNRTKFRVRPFAAKFNLSYPIAINFYYCRKA